MTAKKTSTVPARVKASAFELRDGTKAKHGDIIQIPLDESQRSPLIRWGLRSGNLILIATPTASAKEAQEETPQTAIFDLSPGVSTELPEGEPRVPEPEAQEEKPKGKTSAQKNTQKKSTTSAKE